MVGHLLLSFYLLIIGPRLNSLHFKHVKVLITIHIGYITNVAIGPSFATYTLDTFDVQLLWFIK